jgi:uncharacterized protein (DUF2336 family)
MAAQPRNAESLVALARQGDQHARNELYRSISNLFIAEGNVLSASERRLMRSILSDLASRVEMAVRISLAERLASAPEAPHDLILMLVNDRIEVARPVILRSPLLTKDDLVALIREASPDHQCAVARRPELPAEVCEALSNCGNRDAIITLVQNHTARISAAVLGRLVDDSRKEVRLRAPLLGRPDLSSQLAGRMYEWVSEELRRFIVTRFEIDEASLKQQLGSALNDTQGMAPKRTSREVAAERLVDKLAESGQLRTTFLLKALHQGQREIFEYAFSRLLGLEISSTRRLLYEAGPAALALACRTVGIDRSVFQTVFNLTRSMRGMAINLRPAEQGECDAIFQSIDRPSARQALSHFVGSRVA